MTPLPSWPATPVLHTDDLVLEPLRVQHAEEMAPLLDDEELHTFIGGEPATLDQLRQVYGLQVGGRSPDGTELWFNWVLRRSDTQEPAGYVQATITMEGVTVVAEVAWVVAREQQGRGLARQAATAMVQWLIASGVDQLVAHVHPDHAASNAIAAAVGLHPTATLVEGEVRWTSAVPLQNPPMYLH
ncbi:MAG: GNAT family N-acetyltransferase [Propionibacteriaceae bacterium]|nr:GNAT family N-acetyltransferase [Propionibacteriaceae bacterium]